MKKNTEKRILTKVLLVLTVAFISSCSSSDEIIMEEEIRIPIEEDMSETLKNVNTEWGASKETVNQYMKGYQTVVTSDENLLQFSVANSSVIIAYKFSSDKLCASVMMSKKEDDRLDLSKALEGFSYIGESGSNDIYSNKSKNVFAVSYETDATENEGSYHVVGFTPLLTMTESVNGKECADLGLGVRWATCNIGANSPEDYGGYYAWGETDEKDSYSWSTYKHCAGSCSSCESIGDSICGTEYDVAKVKHGSSWTIPTMKEMDRLRAKCSWVWTKENGVNGYKVFGDNGNYIFLPAAGYKTTSLKSSGTSGYYMTATQYKTASAAYDLEFTNSSRKSSYNLRYQGVSVRAVVK